MILETLIEYNIEMTFIVASMGKESIVIAADGLATDNNGKIICRDFQKLHTITDGVWIGIAANRMNTGDMHHLITCTKDDIDFTPPYTILSIATSFAAIAKRTFGYKDDGFNVQLIVCGYDTDKDGYTKDPHIYRILFENDYEVGAKRGEQVYLLGKTTGDFPPKGVVGSDIGASSEEQLANMSKIIIAIGASSWPKEIGGTGTMVMIRPSGSETAGFDIGDVMKDLELTTNTD